VIRPNTKHHITSRYLRSLLCFGTVAEGGCLFQQSSCWGSMDVSNSIKWLLFSESVDLHPRRNRKSRNAISRSLVRIRQFIRKQIMADNRGYSQNGVDDWATFDYTTMNYQYAANGAQQPKPNRLVKKSSMCDPGLSG